MSHRRHHHHPTGLEAFIGAALIGRAFQRPPETNVYVTNPPAPPARRDSMNEPLHMSRSTQASRVLEALRQRQVALMHSWNTINARVQVYNTAPQPRQNFWDKITGNPIPERPSMWELPRPQEVPLPTREDIVGMLDAEDICTVGELEVFQRRLVTELFAAEYKELDRINFELRAFADQLYPLLVNEAERLRSRIKAINAERKQFNSARSLIDKWFRPETAQRMIPTLPIVAPSRENILLWLQAANPAYQSDLAEHRRQLHENLLHAYAGDPDVDLIRRR